MKAKRTEDSIRRLRAEGLGYHEIGRCIGVNHKTVSRVCHLLGLELTKEERKAINQRRATRVDWDARIKEKTDGAFFFVSAQINEDGESTILIKCAICGNTRTTTSDTVRNRQRIICRVCAESEREHQRERQKADKEYERQQKILRDFIKKPRVQVAMPFCKCGELLRENERICKECKRQMTRSFEKRHELKRHNRIKKFGQIDKDITLERLYKRDAGVCYICGRSCDWSDHKRNENGAFIVGATYPTIDHVKPLSKGGGHVWQNVRLACFTCNTRKSDKEIATREPLGIFSGGTAFG